jgi:hypothetical protein
MKFINPLELAAASVIGAMMLFSRPAYSAPSAPKKTEPVEIFVEANAGVNINSGIGTPASLGSVPLPIRDVPAHPDDYWVNPANVAPIKDSSLSLSPVSLHLDLEGRIGAGIGNGDFSVEIGSFLKLTPGLMSDVSDVIERNYTNFPGTDIEGVGAALTHYMLRQAYNNIVPGIFARVSKGLGSYYDSGENFVYGFIEYSVDLLPSSRIFLENGWDRYGNLQVKDTFSVTDIINHRIKLGVINSKEFENLKMSENLSIGIIIPQPVNTTQLYNDSAMKINPRFFIELSLINFGLGSQKTY